MLAAWSFLKRLCHSALLRPDLIRHEVAPRDADWFVRSRIKQFARFPWLFGDAARGLLALWLLMPVPDRVIGLTVASLAAMWVCELVLRRSLATPIANSERRLIQIQCFLLMRGLIWSIIVGAMVCYAGPNVATVVAFSLGALLFDLLFMLPLPLTGLAAGSLLLLGTAGGLLRTPGINPMVVIIVTVSSIAALRYALFNLYCLFATRQLRTRRLATANGTIRSLLSQYDEHGADALVELDCEGCLVRPSRRLSELLGRDEEELAGMPIANLFEAGRDRSALVAAISRRHQFRNMLVPLRIQGERHWWSLSGCAALDS